MRSSFNGGETFNNNISNVAEGSDLPDSQGPFEKNPASRSLDELRQSGREFLDAQQLTEQSMQRLEGLENVTPEVQQASRVALEATVRSLETKSQMRKIEGGFWNFIGDTFGKNPAIKDRQRAEEGIQGAADYIRETGATGRAMTPEDRASHQKNREEAREAIERATEPRKLGFRERLFNWAKEKATNAMAKHEQFTDAISTIRDQIPTVVQRVDQSLQENVDSAGDQMRQRASASHKAAQNLGQKIEEVKKTNLTGY